MIVLCLGMPGSASTWVFNVVRDLVAAAAGPVQGFEATSLAAVEAASDDVGRRLGRAIAAVEGVLAPSTPLR